MFSFSGMPRKMMFQEQMMSPYGEQSAQPGGLMPPMMGIGRMPNSGPVSDAPPMMTGQPVQRTPPMGLFAPPPVKGGPAAITPPMGGGMFGGGGFGGFTPQMLQMLLQQFGQKQQPQAPIGMPGGGFGGWRGMPRSGPTY